jgi:hypothetical protein
MRFGARLPNDTATLLLLAVFLIVVLGSPTRWATARASTRSRSRSSARSASSSSTPPGSSATSGPTHAPRRRSSSRASVLPFGARSCCSRSSGVSPRSSPSGSSTRSIPPVERSGSRRRSPAS